MQPKPIADTSRLLFPSLRFFITSPFDLPCFPDRAITKPDLLVASRATERAEPLPNCGMRGQKNSRPETPAGMQRHSAQGPGYSDSVEQAGDELLRESAESWIPRLATAAEESEDSDAVHRQCPRW